MPDSPDAPELKATLRTGLLAARHDRPVSERAAAARAVAGHLQTRLHDARGGSGVEAGLRAGTPAVAGYVPTAEEPAHGELPGALGARVLLPVVPVRGRELSWTWSGGGWADGRFGLREPVGPRLPASALGQVDLVVVPALAVGADGCRLGRGGGWYDRALVHAAPTAVLVAVLFDDELLDAVPGEPHDRRVHAVVTPSGGWRDLP